MEESTAVRGRERGERERGGGGRENKRIEEKKVNPISPTKLDSPAFSNSCFTAAASMGRWKGCSESERGRKEGNGKTNPCRGEQRETAAALPQADSDQ